jgi:hypothetical protein
MFCSNMGFQRLMEVLGKHWTLSVMCSMGKQWDKGPHLPSKSSTNLTSSWPLGSCCPGKAASSWRNKLGAEQPIVILCGDEVHGDGCYLLPGKVKLWPWSKLDHKGKQIWCLVPGFKLVSIQPSPLDRRVSHLSECFLVLLRNRSHLRASSHPLTQKLGLSHFSPVAIPPVG